MSLQQLQEKACQLSIVKAIDNLETAEYDLKNQFVVLN